MKTTSIELRYVVPDCTHTGTPVLQYRIVDSYERDAATGSFSYTTSGWLTVPCVVLPAEDFLKLIE